MKQIRMLAQYYVDLMMKLGLVRFSMLLALALVVLAIVVQMAVTMVLHGQVESIDVIRSIFFGLLITPWAVYFLSVVVEQLEESRQRLSRLVDKLEEKAHLKGQKVRRYQYLGLWIFVAIPLPGTGAWTGTLAASLLDMDFKESVLACMGGVLLAGCIMGVLSTLGISAFGAIAG